MLLARLKRQAVSGLAMHIDADADQTARQRALVLVTASHEGGVRATGAHGHAKALAVAHHDVGSPFARWRQQGQGQQVGGNDGCGLLGVDGVHIGLPVHNPAAGGRVLDDGGKQIARQRGFPFLFTVGDQHLNANRLGTGLDDFNGLRVNITGQHDAVAFGFDRALGQCHRFGSGRSFVQHGCIGNRHAGQVRHHGLKVDQCLHAVL